MSTNEGPNTPARSDSRLVAGAGLFFALALMAVLGTGGCTSDEPNVVGTALVTDQVDTVLVPLGVEEINRYAGLIVRNPDVLVNEQEVLYVGEQGGTRSGAILANYDFSNIFTAEYPEELFTEENVKGVKFSLTKLEFYASSAMGDTGAIGLVYEVQQLAEPFNPDEYESYPDTTVPTGIGQFLNDEATGVEGNIDLVPLLVISDIPNFLSWITNGETVGIKLTLRDDSYPGLVGFASMELTHFDEIADEGVGTVVAPNFVVEFEDESIENLLIGPTADTSSFDTVPDPPTDVDSSFLLRTCLRTYPALLFDLSQLPPNAFINRALLSVTNDTTASFGNLEGITVLEWDEVRFSAPYDTTTVDALEDARSEGTNRYSYRVTGQTSLDPTLNTRIQFDVTQAILRVINQVYAPQTRGFLLSAGENFFSEGFSTAVSPDFYYTNFQFMGTAAADPDHRPQLKITYSVVNDLDGEGK